MIFLKGLLGGIIAVVLTWIAIVAVYMLRAVHGSRNLGNTRLTAVAGGWGYLLQRPLVLILLTVAFGAGLWAFSRR